MTKKLTTEEFIEKAKRKHGDKYDYSRVVYKNSKKKVEVICPEHGSFWQIPNSHLLGKGCAKCSNNVRLTTDEFIYRSRVIHNNKYDYSKVSYFNSKKDIIIVCPEHGEFIQKPLIHLQGKGCSKCARNNKFDTNYFIQRAIEIHGDFYDYSNVKYINNHSRVEIVCPEHGTFIQIAASHLNGHGCRKCSNIICGTNKRPYSLELIRKLKYHSELLPFYISEVAELLGIKYSTACRLCREFGIHVRKPNKYISSSKKEKLLLNNVKKYANNYFIKSNFKVLKPNDELNQFIRKHEIDIYIPELNLGFEFNGMYWHKKKPKGYHMEKYNTAKSQGITLYHIWEDEYSCEEDIEFWNKEIEGIINAKKSYYRGVH